MPSTPRPAALALAACIFASLASCGGGDDGTGGETAAEIGTGTIDWVPLAADQDLVIVAGPQGGHHFILHARMRGISPGDPDRPGIDENPSTLFQIFAEDGHQVDAQFPPYKLGFQGVGDGWFVLPSGRIVQFIEGEVDDLYGARLRVRVQIRDNAGREAADEQWVHAVADDDPPDFADAGVPDAGDGDASP